MRHSSRQRNALIVATSLLLFLCFLPTANAQTSLDQVVIMFDASHSPQHGALDRTNGLGLMLDMVNASTRYIVKVNTGAPLNDTLLRDVDVLIIAAPDASDGFTENEIAGVSEALANGTSMFVLGDPSINQTSRYWSTESFRDLGENIAINRFLDALNISAVRFSINQTASDTYWGDTMFDREQALNASVPYVIRVDASTWEVGHPIFKDINDLVLMTATLKPLNASEVSATGFESSFAQFRKGPNSFANISFPNMTLEDFALKPLSYSAINGTYPPWMASFEYGNSRIVILGSAIMFTGRTLDLPSTDSRTTLQWFYTADNSRFFMNVLGWLSEGALELPSAILPMAVVSGAILVIGIAYYLFRRAK